MAARSNRGPGRPRAEPGWHLRYINGRYYAQEYTEHGRGRRNTLSTSEKAVAERALIDLQTDLATPGSDITVGELFERYVADLIRYGKDVKRIQSAAKYCEPLLHLHPRHLIKDRLMDYAAERDEAGYSSGTVRTDLSYLAAALNHAVNKGWLDGYPTIWRPAASERRKNHLHRDQGPAFLAACKPDHATTYAILGLTTAARPSHILQLTWDRVDFERRQVDYYDPKRERNRKGRPIVPLNDTALEHLSLAKAVAETEYVIEYLGAPVNSMWWQIKQAGIRAGIAFAMYPYVLRHTAAIWMAERGIAMEMIAQYLGHTSAATTYKHYARYTPDYLQKAASQLNVRPSTAIGG